LIAFALLVHHAGTQNSMRRSLQTEHDIALAADKAKSRFLATASHDLRQPLHAVNLFVSALRRRVSDPEAAKLRHYGATATNRRISFDIAEG
jgi:signal transduction histidine kinase